MGLILIIPGLVFLLNGTTWFDGENAVGQILVAIGAFIIVAQILWAAFVMAKVRKVHRDAVRRFESRF